MRNGNNAGSKMRHWPAPVGSVAWELGMHGFFTPSRSQAPQLDFQSRFPPFLSGDAFGAHCVRVTLREDGHGTRQLHHVGPPPRPPRRGEAITTAINREGGPIRARLEALRTSEMFEWARARCPQAGNPRAASSGTAARYGTNRNGLACFTREAPATATWLGLIVCSLLVSKRSRRYRAT